MMRTLRQAPIGIDIASPCISVCQMDNSTGWCQGCFRTLDEIAKWGMMGNDEKYAVLQSLRLRRTQACTHHRNVEG